MKRVLVLSLAAVIFAVSFCGCEHTEAHEHTISNEWSYDSAYHWHEPLCGDAEKEPKPHTFLNGTCSVCGYQKQTSGQTDPSGTQQPEEQQPEEQQPEPQQPEEQQPEEQQPEEQQPEEQQPEEQQPEEQQPEEQQPEEQQPEPSLDEKYGPRMPTDDNTITGEPGADGLVTYRIRINRRNGRKISWMIPLENGSYSLNYPSIRVKDERGEVHYDGNVPRWAESLSEDDAVCMLDLKLEKGVYTVELKDLPEGFVYEREYTLSSQRPLLDLRLNTKLRQSGASLSPLTEGMVMPDLKIKSINKGETTLGALLKQYQLVIFTFSSRTCYWCQQEMATLVKMYKKYKGAFTYVFFDTVDTDEDIIMDYLDDPTWYGDLVNEFYIASDKKNDNLYLKFPFRAGIPTNLFIDSDGYVFLIAGGLNEERFERVLYYNLERSAS